MHFGGFGMRLWLVVREPAYTSGIA